MIFILAIIFEIIFITFLVFFLYRVKSWFGLAPLYILIGSNQFFETLIATTFQIKIFSEYTISPGAIILFSATVFIILFIYIKEGTQIAQRFIFGIILSNISFAILLWFTQIQTENSININNLSSIFPDLFNLNYGFFLNGTIILLVDSLIIVIVYEFLLSKIKWIGLYTRLLIVILFVLNLDAVLFIMINFWGSPEMGNKIIGQLIAKSFMAVYFASVLYLYLRYFDKEANPELAAEKAGNEDIFSILTYKGKLEKLQTEKGISDEYLKNIIDEKTKELEKSVKRFIIMASLREFKIDEFTSSNQAGKFLKVVQEAFEVDACSIYILKDEKLELLSSVGINQDEIVHIRDVNTPFLDKVLNSKSCQVIEDTKKDPAIIKAIGLGLQKFMFKSCVGAPLRIGDQVLGIIKLYATEEIRIFTSLELEHFYLIANHLVYSIDNNRLFEQNESQKEILKKEILARKKIEEAIKESEEKFRTLVRQAADGIFLIDLEGNYLEANDKAAIITGYSIEELKTMNGHDILLTEELKNVPFKLEEIKKGDPVYLESFIRRKDNAIIAVDISAKLMTNGKVISTIRDITERKKAEEKLAESENRLRAIYETEPECIKIIGPKCEIYEMNPAGLLMIESDNLEQVQGWSFVNIITPQYKKAFEKLTRDVFNGKSGKLEFEIIGLKGTHRWMQIHAVPMKNADGKIISLLGITHDTTENKKIETDLIQAKELAEESVKVKELFLANMSHEIRTPMNAIIGMSEILQENNLSLDQKECVNVIKLSADNLLSIINNILDFSKLEVGQVLFEILPFNLDEILKGVMQTLHFTNYKENITLTYNISNDIPQIIIGDSVRLRQILLNLASNSLKFTEIGNINIEIQLENQQDNIYSLTFKVTDTGIGIPNEKLFSIFESFVQGSSETTRKYGGTGLGLAITKQLVELQGGSISVSSTPNQGSCFFFKLGFRKGDSESISAKTEENNVSYSEVKGLKILLVEDNLVNQLLARKILMKWNCKVDIADNGRIAIEKLSIANYDIILMDIQMPEMDGCEATKHIRNNMSLPTSEIPIIAVTANALVGEAEKYIAIGMNDYISKPFSQKILYEKIIRWTGRDKTISS
jgi:PAS domain S-box-containing protein